MPDTSKQNGRAIVWSVGGITYTGGIASASADAFHQKLDFSRESDVSEVKDQNGDVATRVFSNHRQRLAVTVVPCAVSGTNTVANAKASASAWIPLPGSLVTVVEALGVVSQGVVGGITVASAGVYTVESGPKLSRTPDGAAQADLELLSFLGNAMASVS